MNTTSMFPQRQKLPDDAFTGDAFLSPLVARDKNNDFTVGSLIYEPRTRSYWHSHPKGQILIIIEGEGLYQEKGKPVQIIHKGDVIKCLPGILHWHGASPGSSFAYIAVTPTTKGKTIWLQRVTNEEYKSVK